MKRKKKEKEKKENEISEVEYVALEIVQKKNILKLEVKP